jgi:hypothetical protein
VPAAKALAPIEHEATPSAFVVAEHEAVPTCMVTPSPVGIASPWPDVTVAEKTAVFSLPRPLLDADSATVVVLESFATTRFWVGLELDVE